MEQDAPLRAVPAPTTDPSPSPTSTSADTADSAASSTSTNTRPDLPGRRYRQAQSPGCPGAAILKLPARSLVWQGSYVLVLVVGGCLRRRSSVRWFVAVPTRGGWRGSYTRSHV